MSRETERTSRTAHKDQAWIFSKILVVERGRERGIELRVAKMANASPHSAVDAQLTQHPFISFHSMVAQKRPHDNILYKERTEYGMIDGMYGKAMNRLLLVRRHTAAHQVERYDPM